LAEIGFSVGRDVTVDYPAADHIRERPSARAADLVGRSYLPIVFPALLFWEDSEVLDAKKASLGPQPGPGFVAGELGPPVCTWRLPDSQTKQLTRFYDCESIAVVVAGGVANVVGIFRRSLRYDEVI
jgi:hypothetical protein